MEGGKGRTLKLTMMTSHAFAVSTKTNIEASKFFLTEKRFDYVLPAIWADEILEKLFVQAGQRYLGNFYINCFTLFVGFDIEKLVLIY